MRDQRPLGVCGDCGRLFDSTTPQALALASWGIHVCPECVDEDDREMQERRRLRGDIPIDGRY